MSKRKLSEKITDTHKVPNLVDVLSIVAKEQPSTEVTVRYANEEDVNKLEEVSTLIQPIEQSRKRQKLVLNASSVFTTVGLFHSNAEAITKIKLQISYLQTRIKMDLNNANDLT